MDQQLYALWCEALENSKAHFMADANDGIPFDVSHRTSQLIIEANFGLLCRHAGVRVPVAVGADLYDSQTIFDSSGHIVPGQEPLAAA
jgi:hypothetical protein